MHSFIFNFLILNFLRTESATYINGVCVDCESAVLVPAGGSTSAAPLLRQLSFSFALVEPTIEVNFVSQSIAVAMDHLQTACRKTYELDFAGLDYPLAAFAATTPLISEDLQSIPVVAVASVVTYNIPEFTPNVDPDVILSRQNLYDILHGNLTLWSDPRLIATNPLLAGQLPNKTISVALRTDPSGTTGAVMTVLENMDQNYGNQFYTTWPKPFYALPNRIPCQGSTGVIAAVTSNPYSLGFVAQAYVEEAGLAAAKLENRAGAIVDTDTDVGVFAAVLQLTSSTSFDSLNPADMLGNESWPLSQLIHLVYHTDVQSGCDSRVAMTKFIHWMLTDPNALSQIFGYPGFMPLPTLLVNKVLRTIGGLTCTGDYLLQETYQDYGNDGLTESVTILSAVLIVISVSILSTLSYKRNNRITRAAGLAFASFFLLGCIFNYIAAIFWASIPTNTSICIGRYAFVAVGYSLILGAMFAKCWEISKIFYRAEKGDISPFKELPWWMFCRAFIAVVFFEVLCLFVWLMVDPPLSNTVIYDQVNILAIHVCTTKYPAVWYGLHFVYFGVVLGWGAYLAYVTRDIWQKYNYPNESRSILLSIYNLGFCSVILVPLLTALDASPAVLFFLISVAIIFPTTFALVVVHGPKMLAFVANSVSSNGSRGGAYHTPQSGPHSHNEVELSHTVKILKAADRQDHEKERKKSLDDQSGHMESPVTPQFRPLTGTKSLEDITEVPRLDPTWKILTPSNNSPGVHVEVPSAFDAPEVTNPLFGENV